MNYVPIRLKRFAESNPKLAGAGGLVLCFLVLVAVYTRLSLTGSKNSDDAALVLEARDILRGNILLHGWTLPLDTFYTTDIPLYVVGALFATDHATPMYVIPAAEYALIVVLCIATVWKRVPAVSKAISVLFIISIIVFPALTFGPPTEGGGDHVIVLIFLLAAFWLLSSDRFVAAAIVLALADIGDPLAVWIGNLAIGAVGLRMLTIERRRAIRMLTVVAAAGIIWKLADLLIRHFGGFQISAGLAKDEFVPLSKLSANLYQFVASVLVIFDANFFGRQVESFATMLVLVHFALLLFMVWAVVRLIRRSLAGEWEIMTELLWMTMAADAAAFILSAHPGDLASARYLVPLLIYGTLLVALAWSALGIERKYFQYLLPVILLSYAVGFTIRTMAPIAANPTDAVEYIESKGLKEGYGSYWSAGILTVMSNGDLHVRQVTPGPGGVLVPYRWLSAAQWYDAPDARFAVFDSREFIPDISRAVMMWGQPQEIKTIDGYHIAIWGEPIHVPQQ